MFQTILFEKVILQHIGGCFSSVYWLRFFSQGYPKEAHNRKPGKKRSRPTHPWSPVGFYFLTQLAICRFSWRERFIWEVSMACWSPSKWQRLVGCRDPLGREDMEDGGGSKDVQTGTEIFLIKGKRFSKHGAWQKTLYCKTSDAPDLLSLWNRCKSLKGGWFVCGFEGSLGLGVWPSTFLQEKWRHGSVAQ